MRTMMRFCTGALLALAACETTIEGDPAGSAAPRAETVRVAGTGDAADDPAIWVAPDPAASLILGTDKTAGLYVFDLEGQIRQTLLVGRLNNVDLRGGFMFGGREQVLVVATDRTNIALAVFLLDPATGEVTPAPGGSIPLDVYDPYGVCLHAAPDGRFMAAVTGTEGELRQFVLRDGGGTVAADPLRRGDLRSQSEGCVFDDRTGLLYVGEEAEGIWRMAADPAVSQERMLVHPVDNAALVADVEGLAIYPLGGDGGFLVASSQGDSAYTLFALPEGRYVGRVRTVAGEGIDATTGTDGLEASSAPLPGYPLGVLVVQDDEDDAGGQNFKLIDWADVAAAISTAPAGGPQADPLLTSP